VDVYVATRDAELEPEAMLAMGIRASEDRSHITVYLPEVLAEATLRNLEQNGSIAVTLERASDMRAVQIKGRSRGIRPSNESDKELQTVFRAALVEQFATVGIPRSTTRRIAWWPSVAVEVEIQELFLQTPGPAAGEPFEAAR
jgi:hypothetical protein